MTDDERAELDALKAAVLLLVDRARTQTGYGVYSWMDRDTVRKLCGLSSDEAERFMDIEIRRAERKDTK